MLQKNVLIYAAIGVALYFIFKIFASPEKRGRYGLMSNRLLQSDFYSNYLKGKKITLKTATPKPGMLAAEPISASETEALAKRIWDAKSPVMGIGDKDESVISAFAAIPTQAAVAMVAKRFKELYGRNLADFLDFMDNINMKRLNDAIAVLPTGVFKANGKKWVELTVLK